MAENLIIVENVSKKFRMRQAGGRTLKSASLDFFRKRGVDNTDYFWALKDINFTVPAGETLGIIGCNGAGKSTLLSLLAGTKQPSTGKITMKGTVSSLLELGAGFHPELTGRENIFLSGAIMGLSRKKMVERMDAIVDFAGLNDFIDQPVKHYSSGMYVRLGFAVSVEVDPSILLIDEVLAVGDTAFQRKCIAKMEEFRARGKTMLIISHDLSTIQSISDRILLLDEGHVIGIGDPEEQVGDYESITRKRSAKSIEREWGTGEVKLTNVELRDESGAVTDKFKYGKDLIAKISYDASIHVKDPVFGFSMSDLNGRLIYGNNTQIENHRIAAISGKGDVELRIKNLPMSKGTYILSFSVHSWDHKVNYHRLDNRFPIAIESDKRFEGCCFIPTEWSSAKK